MTVAHVPTFNREASPERDVAVFRGACSCGWRSSDVRRGKRGKALAAARDKATRDAIAHVQAERA